MNFITYINTNGLLKTVPFSPTVDGYITDYAINEQYLVTSVFFNGIKQKIKCSSLVQLAVINDNNFSDSILQENHYNNEGTRFEFQLLNNFSSSSPLPLALSDTSDLAFLKSLMKVMYPANVFTYEPIFILENHGDLDLIQIVPNQNICYYVALEVSQKEFGFSSSKPFVVENSLRPYRDASAKVSRINFDAEVRTPVLLTDIIRSEVKFTLFGRGYKIISDLPLYTIQNNHQNNNQNNNQNNHQNNNDNKIAEILNYSNAGLYGNPPPTQDMIGTFEYRVGLLPSGMSNFSFAVVYSLNDSPDLIYSYIDHTHPNLQIKEYFGNGVYLTRLAIINVHTNEVLQEIPMGEK